MSLTCRCVNDAVICVMCSARQRETQRALSIFSRVCASSVLRVTATSNTQKSRKQQIFVINIIFFFISSSAHSLYVCYSVDVLVNKSCACLRDARSRTRPPNTHILIKSVQCLSRFVNLSQG